MFAGKLFQSLGATTMNALSPRVAWCLPWGGKRLSVPQDLNLSALGHNISQEKMTWQLRCCVLSQETSLIVTVHNFAFQKLSILIWKYLIIHFHSQSHYRLWSSPWECECENVVCQCLCLLLLVPASICVCVSVYICLCLACVSACACMCLCLCPSVSVSVSVFM